MLSTRSSTSKNVNWPHFSWPTLYLRTACLGRAPESAGPLHYRVCMGQ